MMYLTKLILLNFILIIIFLKLTSYILKSLSDDLKADPIDLETPQLEDFSASFAELLEINSQIQPQLNETRNSLFFKIFKVNFNSECNFWSTSKLCNLHTCTICFCEDKDIPAPWRKDSAMDTVDKTHKDASKFNQFVEKYNYSSPQWLVESEVDNTNGIFVDLSKNQEAYTGYQGQKIWEAIYLENCFAGQLESLCSEERVFYRIVSGLHSNINIHLSHNYLDEERNITYVNASMLNSRLTRHPDRMKNLFFLYSVLLRTFVKAQSTLESYDYSTGETEKDAALRKGISSLYSALSQSVLVKNIVKSISRNKVLKNFIASDKIDQMKMRFRNISSLIDCVGCQKCKLHGKLQMYGLATMFKILFEKDTTVQLKRNELVAFVNVFGKVSNALKFLAESKARIDEGKRSFRIKVYIGIAVYIVLILGLNWWGVKYGERNKKRGSLYRGRTAPAYMNGKAPMGRVSRVETRSDTSLIYSHEEKPAKAKSD